MSIRILLIDDDLDTVRAYQKALKRKLEIRGKHLVTGLEKPEESLQLEIAETVPAALKKMENQRFDILVVDLKIPGSDGEEMGGLEIIEESLNRAPLRPIIAITGYGSVALARRTLKQGVFDFIEKSAKAVQALVAAVQKAIDTSDEKVLRSGNPFTPMSGLEPSIFGGRKRELEFFEDKINRALYSGFCEHFLVLGKWGIGKSTLLREYKKICQSRGHWVSIVPLEPFQPSENLLHVATSIVEGILRNLPYPVEKFEKLIGYFDSIGFSFLGSGLQLSRDTSQRQISPQAFLYDSLLRLWDDLEGKSDIIVILLDDLENLLPVPEIVTTLKQTLSMDRVKETKILLGITSTPGCWNQLTSIKRHHPLARYFLSRIQLESLAEEELRETVFSSLRGTGVTFVEEIVKLVYEYTDGHPFEMQVLCHHLFNNQLSRRVDVDVWEKALQTALEDLGIAVFDNRFRMASDAELKVLKILAEKDDAISVQQIPALAVEKKINIAPKSIGKHLQRLVEKELIEKSKRGKYRIPDHMFRAYLRNI